MNINILDLLLEHDVILKSTSGTGRVMTAAEFEGFIVQRDGVELYIGIDFDTALMWLEGREDKING